jgi:putative membrane protein
MMLSFICGHGRPPSLSTFSPLAPDENRSARAGGRIGANARSDVRARPSRRRVRAGEKSETTEYRGGERWLMSDDSGELRGAVPAWLVVYVKGLCMGAADAVPGVSGGTIALLAGIYERLIDAITAVSPRRILDVLSGFLPGRRARAVAAFRAVDAPFLLVLGAGILTAIITVTRVVHAGITDFPVPTFGFFFGLIAASAWVLLSELSLDTRGRVGAAVFGFVFAFVVSGRADAALGTGPVVTFVAGAIAVSAMILPGLSGSLLLVLLGQYEYMTGTLKAFVDSLLGLVVGGGLDPVVQSGAVVVAFVLGAFVGLFTVSHAIRWALEHHRKPTLAFLVALIVGALRAPVESAGDRLAEMGRAWSVELVAVFVLAAVVGGLAVVAIDRYAGLADLDEDGGPKTGAQRGSKAEPGTEERDEAAAGGGLD